MRWIARIWTLPILAVALLSAFMPDPYATEPVPVEDWFLLSLWGIALVGLLIAWRWELVGGIIALATMFVRELAWVVLKGGWIVSFLIVWAAMAPPAVLFLLSWRLRTRTKGDQAHPL